MSSDNAGVNAHPPPVDHYENFPVASWLCPPRLRMPIAAIYHFARVADDIADEGDAPAAARLADLADYRADLAALTRGMAPSARWPHVFQPLAAALREFSLPPALLGDLLSAFEQDVVRTRDVRPYADRQDLLAYCRLSANPVGRLLLHLYGVSDEASLRRSDCICSALQLINFWQDLSVDIGRGRRYWPQADRMACGASEDDLLARRATPQTTQLIASLCRWAFDLMREGAPLVHALPGRGGWELRLVVQGGLRILERIEASGYATLHTRPRLRALDAPLLMWRGLWM